MHPDHIVGSSWTASGLIATLAVPELEAGIRFYERLGFAVEWRWPDPAPSHAGLNLGSTAIMLAVADPGVMGDLYFIVDDVEACYSDLIRREAWELSSELGALSIRPGCPPERALLPPDPPEDQAYGLRDFHIIDPWGHAITFGESLIPEDSSDPI